MKLAMSFEMLDMRILHTPRVFMSVTDVFDKKSRLSHYLPDFARG